MKKSTILSAILIIAFTHQCFSKIVGNVSYNNKTYYVDVVNASTSSKTGAEIWFRVNNNSTSLDDILISKLSADTEKLKYYADLSCRAKTYADGTKTIVGCMSVVGSVFCAGAAIETAGATAFVCTTTWDYAIATGAADCLEGIGDAIANHLSTENQWKVLGLLADIHDAPKLSSVILKAIDYMCEDVKIKKQ